MSDIKYQYWNTGDPLPDTIPEGCEYDFIGCKWYKEEEDPSEWRDIPRRWPVADTEDDIEHANIIEAGIRDYYKGQAQDNRIEMLSTKKPTNRKEVLKLSLGDEIEFTVTVKRDGELLRQLADSVAKLAETLKEGEE